MRPSGETVQLSARLGAMALPGMGLATASWRAYRIMNGVTIPGVSAGSNQVGASEMWTAKVSCPSAATAGTAAASGNRRRSSAADRRLMVSSSVGRVEGTASAGLLRAPDPPASSDQSVELSRVLAGDRAHAVLPLGVQPGEIDGAVRGDPRGAHAGACRRHARLW